MCCAQAKFQRNLKKAANRLSGTWTRLLLETGYVVLPKGRAEGQSKHNYFVIESYTSLSAEVYQLPKYQNQIYELRSIDVLEGKGLSLTESS